MNTRPTEDADNFQFELDGRKYVMSGGELEIDDCLYEAESCAETYSLARAYWNLTKGTRT